MSSILRRNTTMNLINVRLVFVILSLNLIASCATSTPSPKISSNTLLKSPDGSQELVQIGPEIPFNSEDAFYPLHLNESGVIDGIFYPYEECERRIIICTKWVWKESIFKFEDKEIMKWFFSNDFGFKKRQKP
jgi:hypothetical protein